MEYLQSVRNFPVCDQSADGRAANSAWKCTTSGTVCCLCIVFCTAATASGWIRIDVKVER